jgi:hypothetical protein
MERNNTEVNRELKLAQLLAYPRVLGYLDLITIRIEN